MASFVTLSVVGPTAAVALDADEPGPTPTTDVFAEPSTTISEPSTTSSAPPVTSEVPVPSATEPQATTTVAPVEPAPGVPAPIELPERTPAARDSHGRLELLVDGTPIAADLHAGQQLTLGADGFGPGAELLVALYVEPFAPGDRPVDLTPDGVRAVTVDGRGVLDVDVTLPADVVGEHTLVVVGRAADGVAVRLLVAVLTIVEPVAEAAGEPVVGSFAVRELPPRAPDVAHGDLTVIADQAPTAELNELGGAASGQGGPTGLRRSSAGAPAGLRRVPAAASWPVVLVLGQPFTVTAAAGDGLAPVSHVELGLYDRDGNLVIDLGAATTDVDGAVTFDATIPDDGTVLADDYELWLVGVDEHDDDVNLKADVSVVPAMVMFRLAGDIGGELRLDTHGSGTYEPGAAPVGTEELLVTGATVEVVCVAGAAVLGATTVGADGLWSIAAADLADDANCLGDAIVRVTLDAGSPYVFTNSTDVVAGSGAPVPGQPGHTPWPGNPTSRLVGESLPFPYAGGAAQHIESLVRPDWELSLVIVNGTPLDGTSPFDTAPNCSDDPFTDPGYDCSDSNNLVRGGDVVTYPWSLVGNPFFASSLSTTGDVIFEQEVTFGAGGSANFTSYPAACATAHILVVGGSSDGQPIAVDTLPPADADGVRLICNLGPFVSDVVGNAVSSIFETFVRARVESANGSSMTSTARVYAIDDTGTPTAVPDGPVAGPTTQITIGPPRWNLEKFGALGGYLARRTPPGGVEEWGYVGRFTLRIATDRPGSEALDQPITVYDDMLATALDAGYTPQPDFEWYVLSCGPNSAAVAGEVLGVSSGPPYAPNAVVDSGTCGYQRVDAMGGNPSSDPTDDYEFTFSGIDFGGAHYPTQYSAGAPGELANGPFYVAAYQVEFFIPMRVVDAADGVLNEGAGGIRLWNRIAGFDPVSVSGAANYGGAGEPGYCQAVSVDTTHSLPGSPGSDGGLQCASSGTTGRPALSDNVIDGWVEFGGGMTQVSKIVGQMPASTNSSNPRAEAGYVTNQNGHDGNGLVAPGTSFVSVARIANTVHPGWTNSIVCDVFDNTMTSFVDAWLAIGDDPAVNLAYSQNWVVEYASFAISGDDPLANGFNPTTGRYEGTWTGQAAVTCGDADATWYATPGAVPGGIDSINAVRVRPLVPYDPAVHGVWGGPDDVSTKHELGIRHNLLLRLQMREHFLDGPHDGDPLPEGAVFANYARARADQNGGGAWTDRNYLPSPENSSQDGDRVTVARAGLTLTKQTVRARVVTGSYLAGVPESAYGPCPAPNAAFSCVGAGAANVDQTGQASSGQFIVWQVNVAVPTLAAAGQPVSNLTVTDTLPASAIYDPNCTADLDGAVLPSSVAYNGDGTTTIVWHWPQWVAGTAVPPLRLCTHTDVTAPSSTQIQNHAIARADGVLPTPSDTHDVVLTQVATLAVGKRVDASFDLLNDDQVWRLSAINYSSVTIQAPTLIEVFPYVGDGTAVPPRPNPSAFTPGSNYFLTGAPTAQLNGGGAYPGTFWYTAQAPATISQNLNNDGVNTWCVAGDFGNAGCPASFAAVTGFKFVGGQALLSAVNAGQNGIHVTFTMQAGNDSDPWAADVNRAGDVYTDRFTAFSASFTNQQTGALQQFVSNVPSVTVTGFEVGNLVFADRDGDGRYDPLYDGRAPDGVVVNLYSADGTLRGTTTTLDGRYLFSGLPPGDYYVEIPASEFDAGGPLAGWDISATPSPGGGKANVDQDDSLSHDGYVDGGTLGGGGVLRSHTFTLWGQPSGTGVTGDAPLGEALHGGSPAMFDSLSNRAIDLALAPPPAIDIEKEICTTAGTTSGAQSCELGAALGSGGWAVDGVPGVGPAAPDEEATYVVGDTVYWRITVRNTGGSPLTDVTITDAFVADCQRVLTDPLGTGEVLNNPAGVDDDMLWPGRTWRYQCTSTADVRGQFQNLAVVVATVIDDTGQPTTETVTDDDTANLRVIGEAIQVAKQLDPADVQIDADGNYTAEYLVTVSNLGDLAGTYTLEDELFFGSGISITGWSVGADDVDTPSPTNGGAWNGGAGSPADLLITAATPIAAAGTAGSVHIYRVVVTGTVAASSTTTAASCAGGATPTVGGFLNVATLNPGPDEQTASACDVVDPGELSITKDIDAVVDYAAGTFSVEYTVTVANDGLLRLPYDLDDELFFGTGLTIDSPSGVSVSVAGDPVLPDLTGSTFDGVTDTTVVSGALLNGGGSHVYTIVVTGTIARSMTPSAGTCAGGATPAAGGFLNVATLNPGPDEVTADACDDVDPGELSITKDIDATVDYAVGTFSVEYTVTVANDGLLRLPYDLDDELFFGAGLDIDASGVSVSVAGDPVVPTALLNTGFDGVTDTTIVSGALLNGGGSHVYTIVVTGTVAASSTTTAASCAGGATPTAGGFLNVATLNPGPDEVTADACDDVDPGALSITKDIDATVDYAVGTFSVEYTVTVANDGLLRLPYDLDDELFFGAGLDIDASGVSVSVAGDPVVPTALLNTGFDGVTDTTIVTGALLDGLGEHVYTIVVTGTIAASTTTTAASCAGGATPTVGGFLNVATLNPGPDEVTADACDDVDPGDLTITKDIDATVDYAAGTFSVEYTVTVANGGLLRLPYDLDDELFFGAGLSIDASGVSVSVAGDPVVPTALLNPSFDGVTDTTVVTGALLDGLGEHVYTIVVTGTIAASTTTTAASCAGGATPTVGGFLNVATLNPGPDEQTASACDGVDPGDLTITKDIDATVDYAAGTFSVEYTVTVANDGLLRLPYDLDDELFFGTGLTIDSPSGVSVSVAGDPVLPDLTGSTFDGVTDTTVVTGALLDGLGEHVYTIVVTGTVAASTTTTAASCAGGATPAVGGFLNVATLNPGPDEQTASACDVVDPGELSITKDIDAVVDYAAGTFSVEYTVTVANDGLLRLPYDLDDELFFGTGLTIDSPSGVSVSVAGDPVLPDLTGSTFDGVTDTTVVSGALLNGGGSHVYTIVVTGTVAASTTTTAAGCAGGATPAVGGFLNVATLNPGPDEQTASACDGVDPGDLTITKDIDATVDYAAGTFSVEYTVTVANDGLLRLPYDLDDELFFGTGLTIDSPNGVSVSVAGDPVLPDLTGSTFDGVTDTTVVSGALLNGGGSHVYTIVVTGTVASSMTVAAATCAGGATPAVGGFLNVATLNPGPDEVTADACDDVDPGELSITKTIATPTINADGTFEVVYTVTVANDGLLRLPYDLDDELFFGAGLDVDSPSGVSVSVAGDAVVPTALLNPSFDGVTDTTIVSGALLNGGGSHVYTITVTGTVASSMTVAAATCAGGATPTAGGFLNVATLNPGPGEVTADACDDVDPGELSITKDIDAVVDYAAGTFSVEYTVTVANDGLLRLPYDLDDELFFGTGLTIDSPNGVSVSVTGDPVLPDLTGSTFDGVTDTTIVTGALLNGGGSHVYTIVVTGTVAASTTTTAAGCAGGATPTVGGFLNVATLNPGPDEQTASACDDVDPGDLTITKSVATPTVGSDGTFQVVYTVTVESDSALALDYTVHDTLHFGSGVDVATATVSSGVATPAPSNAAAWTGRGANTLVTSATIGGRTTHTYVVTVTGTIAGTVTAGTADCTLSDGESGTGFLNSATLAYGDHGPQSADACAGARPGELTLAKTVVASSVSPTGAMDVSYTITVHNPGPLALTYDLADDLQFGTGITVLTASVSAGAGTPAPSAPWHGAGPIATGVAINGGDTHTYAVAVTGRVAPTTSATAANCTFDVGETGTGLHNLATLSYNPTLTAEACAPVSVPTVPTVPTGELPATGADSRTLIVAAVAVIAAGVLALLLASRRREDPVLP